MAPSAARGTSSRTMKPTSGIASTMSSKFIAGLPTIVGRSPWTTADALVGLPWLPAKSGSRGTRADQGVCPTNGSSQPSHHAHDEEQHHASQQHPRGVAADIAGLQPLEHAADSARAIADAVHRAIDQRHVDTLPE